MPTLKFTRTPFRIERKIRVMESSLEKSQATPRRST